MKFDNEVMITKCDKNRLNELLQEAAAILEKYPHHGGKGYIPTVTIISRARSAVREAKEWCHCLYEKE